MARATFWAAAAAASILGTVLLGASLQNSGLLQSGPPKFDARHAPTAVAVPSAGYSAAVIPAAGPSESGPSVSGPSTDTLDCGQTKDPVEKLICADPGLIELDRKMQLAYSNAVKGWPLDEIADQKIRQYQWIKERSACGKAKDTRRCVERLYKTRTIEFQIKSGALGDPEPIAYRCEGDDAPLSVVYYSTSPRSVVVTRGYDQVIAFNDSTDESGMYRAEDFEFRDQQAIATIVWKGKTLRCKTGKPNQPDLANGVLKIGETCREAACLTSDLLYRPAVVYGTERNECRKDGV